MSDTAEIIRFSLSDNGIGIITANRPEVRNALNWAAMYALSEAVERLHRSPDLHAVIVTGAGGAFISGGDVRDLHHYLAEEEGLRQHDLMSDTLDRLAALPVPVIAAVEGTARGGGCEVALACDLRIAAADATFGFAQIGMGVTPGWGGAQRLFNLVGYSQAIDLLVTGRAITAHEAQAIGLVNWVCEQGEALGRACELAEAIAEGPPLAVRGIKEILRACAALPAEEVRARERAIFGQVWASDDHAEASAAFLEKRNPGFRGR
jgi:enoyl-CoA hydratase/carnithine racemase